MKTCSHLLLLIYAVVLSAGMLAGCATTAKDPFEDRLAAMSDEVLVSYYRGLNDRIKDIQAGTKEKDRQGVISQDDHIARMPYIIGGEAWDLEQKAKKAEKELRRRTIRY